MTRLSLARMLSVTAALGISLPNSWTRAVATDAQRTDSDREQIEVARLKRMRKAEKRLKEKG